MCISIDRLVHRPINTLLKSSTSMKVIIIVKGRSPDHIILHQLYRLTLSVMSTIVDQVFFLTFCFCLAFRLIGKQLECSIFEHVLSMIRESLSMSSAGNIADG